MGFAPGHPPSLRFGGRRRQKHAPYPPCTVIRQLAELKYRDSARCLRRVTLTEPYRRAVSIQAEVRPRGQFTLSLTISLRKQLARNAN